MDPSKPGRAIANLEVILPKRVIEVSYLMKRQFEAVFLAGNNDGEFGSRVKLFKEDNDNIKINISLENLVLAGDRLCYHVLDVQAEDEEKLAEALTKPEMANRRKPGRPRLHPIGEPAAEQKSKGKPGRPRKLPEPEVEAESEEVEDEEEPKEYGRGKRRSKIPSRFKDEVELDTSLWSIVDGEEAELESSEDEEERDDAKDKTFVARNLTNNSTPVKGRGPGRPRKHPIPDGPPKPRKRRPNYKREQNLPCRLCKKYYKDYLTLWGHVSNIHAEHTQGPSYAMELKELMKVKCKICGKILSNRRNEMVSHMSRVHGEEDGKMYECDECGKQFRRELLVKEHKRRAHPAHDRILCHLCPASFKLKEYLAEHIKYSHNKQQKWQCEICQKTLTSPKNLRRHQRLHGETIYSCNVCGRGFHELANMRRHMLYVHNPSSVDRVKCPHCERDFSTRNNLLAHINGVHLKTSPYYCDICKKYFNRKKQLLEHAQTYHPGVPILSTQDSELAELEAGDEEGTLGEESTMVLISEGNEGEIGTEEGQTYTIMTMPDQTLDQGDTLASLAQVVGSGGAEISVATAQQVLAALEAAGGTGEQSYISVIGQGGEEIQVKVVQERAGDVGQGEGALVFEGEETGMVTGSEGVHSADVEMTTEMVVAAEIDQGLTTQEVESAVMTGDATEEVEQAVITMDTTEEVESAVIARDLTQEAESSVITGVPLEQPTEVVVSEDG